MIKGQDRPSVGKAEAIQRAAAVAEILSSGRQRIEMDREVPPDIMAELHKARLFRIMLPRALGGDEIDLVSLSRVTETIAAADASAAWCIGQGGGCAMSAAFLDADAAQRFFGKPDSVLAWGAGAQGRATEVPGGGYRVSGKWSFASGSRRATALGAHCKVFGADGTPRLRADGRHVETTALFARGKAHVVDDWHVLGLRGTGSDTYEIRDLFVPADEAFDREDLETSGERGLLYTFPAMMAYQSAFSGVMLGLARGMLDDLTRLARTKTPRGATSSLRDSPIFRGDLAKLEARYRSGRLYLHDTFATIWSDVAENGVLTLDHRINARLAATHVINDAAEIVVSGYRAAGSSAVFEDNPFEHRLRDALSASQQVQGRTAHYATVGCHLLGMEPDTLMFI